MNEKDYILGKKSAYRSMLNECIRHLGGDENAEAIAELHEGKVRLIRLFRQVAPEGADWCEDDHLTDIVDNLYDCLGLEDADK